MTDPRLVLVSPPLDDAAPFAARAAAAAAAGGLASLLVRLAATDPGRRKAIVRGVCEAVQPLGVAVIVVGDARLAAHADADGAHLEGPGEELAAALRSLKPKRIVGVGRLGDRDEAMIAGEAEPDYLMFGDPSADGFVRPLDWRLERVGWWAEIFNLPCIGYAAAADEVAALARAGADFVALGDWVWREADPAGIVARAAGELALARPAA